MRILTDKYKKIEKTTKIKQRFSTRKLKKGIVSVLLGFTLFFGNNVLLPSGYIDKAYAEEEVCYPKGEYDIRKKAYDEYSEK